MHKEQQKEKIVILQITGTLNGGIQDKSNIWNFWLL